MPDLPERTSAAILPLPEDAIAQIKSSTTITSLNGVVLGLLENSLDAQATRIDISVDFRRGGCSIEDNGLGILPSEFRESGGLGRMYHTSKRNEDPRVELHGGQGTFVASVAALSQMIITSRHFQHYSHNTLTIHRSKPISRLIPAPPQHEIRNPATHGTRATVRDLFGNMPVRVKQRATTADETSEIEKQWQSLKRGIVALLLPWRTRLTVKISDAENPARNASISTSANHAPNALNERNPNSLNQKMSSLNPSMVLNILAQAGFISAESKESWIPASASTLSVTVKGLISLEPAPSRSAQFISIGITPCLDENRHNELYDTVNSMFNQSSFGKVEDEAELDSAETERRKHDRRYKTDGPTNKQLRGGRKGVDRWPKFYFHIEIKNDTEAQPVSRLSDMRLRSITNVLEALTTQWLEANKFRPRNPKRSKKTTTTDRARQVPGSDLAAFSAPSSLRIENDLTSRLDIRNSLVRTASQAGFSAEQGRSTRGIDGNSDTALSALKLPFTDWSRIRSAKPQMYNDIWGCKMPLPRQQLDHPSHDHLEKRPVSASEVTPRIQVEKVLAGHLATGDTISYDAEQDFTPTTDLDTIATKSRSPNVDEVVEWINPTTREIYKINARTGIVMPDVPRRPATEGSMDRLAAAANPQISSVGRPLCLERRRTAPVEATAPPSPWLDGVLHTWKNPIFANQPEQGLLVAGFEGPGSEVRENGHLKRQIQITDSFLQSGRADTSRLSKAALAHAKVISQVDRKFILMKMPSLAGSASEQLDFVRQLLVLMDQHAASERCILETLLTELCTPAFDVPTLTSSLGYTSAITTARLDKPLQFQIPAQEETMFKLHAAHFARWGVLYDVVGTRLSILTLPPVISERCTSSPPTLIELLRTELWNMDQNTSRDHTTPANASWLQQIGSCPSGILQLLNSRACRSAIMFNDELALGECEALVQELAGCVFPFMCAHGRNSVVPLVYLEGGDREDTVALGGIGERVTNGKDDRKEEGFVSAWKKWREKKA